MKIMSLTLSFHCDVMDKASASWAIISDMPLSTTTGDIYFKFNFCFDLNKDKQDARTDTEHLRFGFGGKFTSLITML